MRSGALRAGVLALLLLAGCWDEEKPCKASSECARGDICVGPGAGPYYCQKDCTEMGTCDEGTCTALTSADCPTCEVVTKACLVNRAL